jgi:hypothetical protein
MSVVNANSFPNSPFCFFFFFSESFLLLLSFSSSFDSEEIGLFSFSEGESLPELWFSILLSSSSNSGLRKLNPRNQLKGIKIYTIDREMNRKKENN